MQINIKKISYNIFFCILLILIISCSTFQSLQPIQKIDYNNLEIKKFDKINHLTYSGISITIPEDWMFLPPVEESKFLEVFRFISPDGNTTGVMQLLIEEPFIDEKSQNNNDTNNNGFSDNNKNNANEEDESNLNKNSNNNTEGDVIDNQKGNNIESENQNDSNKENNENNQSNNNQDGESDNQEEDDKKIKPLNEHLEILLEEKSDYRYAWYLKRYDDKAKGYLSKLINTKADFVYYAYFIDERSPNKRLYRLIMIERNLTPPTGNNPHLSLSQEKVDEINPDLLSIFSSIAFTEDYQSLKKQRFDIGISLIKSEWVPYFDDTIYNVFYLEHNLQMALVQMKNLGYKYSEDKDYVIQSMIENFKINNPVIKESDENSDGSNNNDKDEEDNEEEPDFIEENIVIDGIDAYSLTVNQYTNPNFQDARLKIKKIFLVIRDEIYELALLYDGTIEDLEIQIDEIIKNVYIKK